MKNSNEEKKMNTSRCKRIGKANTQKSLTQWAHLVAVRPAPNPARRTRHGNRWGDAWGRRTGMEGITDF